MINVDDTTAEWLLKSLPSKAESGMTYEIIIDLSVTLDGTYFSKRISLTPQEVLDVLARRKVP